jgi:hypothetical protein
MLVGAGSVMYASDVFAELERTSQRLAASSGYREARTREDVLKWHAPRGTIAVFAVGLLLIAAGIAVKALPT